MARFTAPITDALATRNITTLYRLAIADGIVTGIGWYADAQRIADALATRYGVTLAQAAGVIAATSPLNSWGANVNLAGRILADHAEGITTTAGYLGTGLRKAAAILSGADIPTTLNSPKITNFWACIVSGGTDLDAVCIDRHAWDIVTNTRHRDDAISGDESLPVRPGITGTRYAWAADGYRRAARILSREMGRPVAASEVQAVTWIAWRRNYWAPGAFDGHALSA